MDETELLVFGVTALGRLLAGSAHPEQDVTSGIST